MTAPGASERAALVVVGSLNMDFVVSVDRLPAPGETAMGRDFQMLAGGKGANQACAAAKLGGRSTVARMVGRVGEDVFGSRLKASLSAAGVDVSAVYGGVAQPTGVALICVESGGQNSIVVASGANRALTPEDLEAARAVFRGARFILFQLESPLATVASGLELARREGARTILDPAPAQPLDRGLLAAVDILTPNETEASILLGLAPGPIAPRDAPPVAQALRRLGPKAVVMKLGERGCFYLDAETELFAPAFPMAARDTTAAGDIFNAALAVALAEAKPMPEALRFANAAAAISVTRRGAQDSIPTRAEVDALLAASAAS